MKRAPIFSSFFALAATATALFACSGSPAEGTGTPAPPGGGTSPITTGGNGTAGTTPLGTGGGSAGMPTEGGGQSTGGQVTTGGMVGGGGESTGGQTTVGGGGATSVGGAGSPGGRPSGPSAGCTKNPPNETPGSGILHMIDINGMDAKYTAGYTHRKYCTTIPKEYDPTKPYPVVFYGPGCGATACEGSSFNGRTDIFIVQAISGADAKSPNLVPPSAAPGCFQAGKNSTVDSPEGPYFDQVMAQVEDNYCIDKGKIFAAGTSSGAWLSNYLACARGNVIRGTASDSGGLQFDHPMCTGGASVMEMPGDSANSTDAMGRPIGAAVARDLFIKTNGCSMTATTMTFGGSSCQVYGGCASPVLWCDVGGGHQSGNNKLSPVTAAFWPTLMP
jgi:polyhydroxybutyrate depolymerase